MADHTVQRLQTSMPLNTAETIVDEALKAGAAAGLLPLTVAVLDVGGHLVVLKRQDAPETSAPTSRSARLGARWAWASPAAPSATG
jgi:uncharacterized protein GlcG (DUF336 family)